MGSFDWTEIRHFQKVSPTLQLFNIILLYFLDVRDGKWPHGTTQGDQQCRLLLPGPLLL